MARKGQSQPQINPSTGKARRKKLKRPREENFKGRLNQQVASNNLDVSNSLMDSKEHFYVEAKGSLLDMSEEHVKPNDSFLETVPAESLVAADFLLNMSKENVTPRDPASKKYVGMDKKGRHSPISRSTGLPLSKKRCYDNLLKGRWKKVDAIIGTEKGSGEQDIVEDNKVAADALLEMSKKNV